MMPNSPSNLSAQSIDQLDPQKTAQLLQHLHDVQLGDRVDAVWLRHTDSTRHALTRRLRQQGQRMMVVAEQQSQGVGQAGRLWQSPLGNLYFSYAQTLTSPLQGTLAIEVALSILQQPMFADHVGFGIKWPNDLHYHLAGKWVKWGGILVEPLGRQQVMIGVGINCVPMHQHVLDQPVTDLSTIYHSSPNRMTLAVMLAQACQQAIHSFEQGSPALQARFCPFDSLANHQIGVQQAHQTLSGRADGIDADGALRLMTNDGLHRLYSGQVRRYD